MFRPSIIYLTTALVLLSPTSLGAISAFDDRRHIRVLQSSKSNGGTFGASPVCVATNGGKTFRTEEMGLLVWLIYNLLGFFLGTTVHSHGFSCDELCPCSNDGLCAQITSTGHECSCNNGFEFDGTTCTAMLNCDETSGVDCLRSDETICGGNTGLTCPIGLACVDDPTDDCRPEIDGENCIGICVTGTSIVKFFEPNINNIFPMDSQFLAMLNAHHTPYGIWSWATYRPHKANKQIYPGLRGGPIIAQWEDIEVVQGVYDWSAVSEYMEAAVADGLYFTFEILVGPMSPEWLYQQGVSKVFTDIEGWQFPYYFDPLYLASFDKLNREVINHLKQLPADQANNLHAAILNDGSTGDPFCYKGEPLDQQYAISRSEWDEFRRENYQSIHTYLGSDGLDSINLAFVHVSDETDAFLNGLFPRVEQFKNGMASHGYHIPIDEAELNDQISQAFDGDPALGGSRIRWFGELDREWLNGWFQKAPAESFWWSAIYALHMGLSRWFIRDDALAVADYHFAFDFFNKYAPYNDAASSPHAFCALREGLDASDTSRFSESAYGMVDGESLSRVLNILDDYKDRGALVEDASVTGDGAMDFRQRSGYVDVFYGGGVRGNYHRFLYQIDPDAESIGWWHVGSNDWPYGCFARSFQVSSGRTAMHFRLDDNFITDKSASHSVRISVIYYDEGDGLWELLYNDAGTGLRSAVSVKCGNTATWKKMEIDLSAAVLNHGLKKGADLILNHISGTDTKFHMIELDHLK